MSTHQSPLPAAPFSSSEVLNVLHRGREHAAREKNSFPRRMERMKNDTKVMGPDAIWGQYNNYRSNGLMGSVVVHAVLLGLILFVTFIPKAVELVKPHETVTLIAPSPDEYALPVAKKIIAGGGGGGTREKLPAPKAALPKPAMEQITPPAIVVHQQPKLAVQPTVVVPPTIKMADNHMPNLGDPQAPALPSMPARSRRANGSRVRQFLTSSTPAIRPTCRMSPTLGSCQSSFNSSRRTGSSCCRLRMDDSLCRISILASAAAAPS